MTKQKHDQQKKIAIGCSVGIILLIALVLGLGFGLGWFSSSGGSGGGCTADSPCDEGYCCVSGKC